MSVAKRIFGSVTVALLLALPAAGQEFYSNRITVSTAGTGDDVVLVPGLGSSPAIWSDLVEALPHYRFHLVHVNGFAGAGAGANAEGSILPAVAGEVARYIQELEIGPVPLIGHSFGGTIVLTVASMHPDAADRSMVVDMPAFMGGIMGATPATVDDIAAGVMAASASLDDAARQQQDAAFVAASVKTERERGPVLDAMLASDPVVMRQAMYDLIIADLRPLLADIDGEVTVVFAQPAGAPDMTKEQVTGFYQSEYGAAAELTLEFVAEAGHFIMLDQPAIFAEAVERFLQ